MSAAYTSGKVALLSTANLLTNTINAYLVGPGYTFSAAHTSLSSVSAADRKGPVALAGKGVADGRFTASPTTFPGVNTPPASIRAVLLTIGASDLLAYIDDFGLGPGNTSIALNGSDIIVTWDASGIFFI